MRDQSSETDTNPRKTDGGVATRQQAPIPSYESEQYLPSIGQISDARNKVLKQEFGYVRAFFKRRPEKHWKLQEQLNQARYGTTYDIYLTWSVIYGGGAAIVGALSGLFVTYLLATLGVFAQVSLPFALPGGIAGFVEANQVILGGTAITGMTALLAGAGVWFGRYYHPQYVVDVRRRRINITLPHAIVYMYALSFGGMDIVQVLNRLAASKETYGDVANEFDMIVRDIDMFGNDLFTSIRNARNLTPSDNLEQFLDDMLSMLDSGGEITTFFRGESEKYMDRSQREQESFLDTLELLSEVFIFGFVAAPLFLVVTFMTMSFLGADTITLLGVIVYAVVPLGMVIFVVLISTLSEPYKQADHELSHDSREANLSPDGTIMSHPGFDIYRGIRYRKRFLSVVLAPAKAFRRKPLLTLVVTLPVAAAFVYAGITSGLEPTRATFIDKPIVSTLAFIVGPFLITAVPLSAFHEYEARRKRQIAERLPDTLDILASANQMGVSLVDGIELVAHNTSGTFAEELKKTRNDMRGNHNIQHALRSLAERLQVPQLTRTCHILAEGAQSTGDLHKILGIASEDTRHRFRLDQNRQQELNSYVAIVVIGFLVYLGVIVVLSSSFLEPVAAQAQASAGSSGMQESPISLDSGTVNLYNTLLFHSAVTQAIGTGMISGKLTNNSVLTGLKYSIGLVLLAVVVFVLL